jgi:hypothetical protein
MKSSSLLHRLSFAVALSLSAASLVAFAAEPSDTTEIEVVSNGKSEKVSITDLKIGETRQLYSEAGTLVTATRTAESLELDIAGDKTSIRMLDHPALDDAELAALIEAHGGGEGDVKQVIRLHRDHADAAHAAGHGDGPRHKVIVLSGKDGEEFAHDGEHAEFLLKHGDAGTDGKRVIVKRHLEQRERTEVK